MHDGVFFRPGRCTRQIRAVIDDIGKIVGTANIKAYEKRLFRDYKYGKRTQIKWPFEIRSGGEKNRRIEQHWRREKKKHIFSI